MNYAKNVLLDKAHKADYPTYYKKENSYYI